MGYLQKHMKNWILFQKKYKFFPQFFQYSPLRKKIFEKWQKWLSLITGVCLFLTSFLPETKHFDLNDHSHLMKEVFLVLSNLLLSPSVHIKVFEVSPTRSIGLNLIISLKWLIKGSLWNWYKGIFVISQLFLCRGPN